MRALILIFCLLSTAALGQKLHSKVETSVKGEKELTLTFQVIPDKDLMVTSEGPWVLTLKDPKGLELPLNEKGAYQIREYQENIPGFQIKATPKQKNGSFAYELRSFVCKKDKTRCFTDLHKGTLEWGKP